VAADASHRPERCYVGLGSNLGDRSAQLDRALALLAAQPGLRLLRASRHYETAPWGVTDQPPFRNAVAELETTLEPTELLAVLKAVERELGRQPRRRWGEREIDLDLLLYGERRVVEPELEVPHPRMWERLFVLKPLAELRPDLRAPDGRTIQVVIQELQAGGEPGATPLAC
jgi:2-amino-4-hydroxy-6-hydroxymethyldihydropteridine diphosphokinase